jgi:hypothetical protein
MCTMIDLSKLDSPWYTYIVQYVNMPDLYNINLYIIHLYNINLTTFTITLSVLWCYNFIQKLHKGSKNLYL